MSNKKGKTNITSSSESDIQDVRNSKIKEIVEDCFWSAQKRKTKLLDIFLAVLGLLIAFFGVAVPIAFFYITWDASSKFEKNQEKIEHIQSEMSNGLKQLQSKTEEFDRNYKQLQNKTEEFDRNYNEILLRLEGLNSQCNAMENLLSNANKTSKALTDKAKELSLYIQKQKKDIGKYITEIQEKSVEYLIDQIENKALYSLENKLYLNAINEYDKLIKIKYENEIICSNLGFAYFQINEYEKAISCYKKAIDISPSPQIYFDLAVSEFRDGKYNQSIASINITKDLLTKGNTLKEMDSLFMGGLSNGNSKKEIDKSAEGRKYTYSFIVIRASVSNCYCLMAANYNGLNDIEQAEENYKNALDHDIDANENHLA